MTDIIDQIMRLSGPALARTPWPRELLQDCKTEIESLRTQLTKARAEVERKTAALGAKRLEARQTEVALTSCKAQLALAVKCGEQIYGMLQAHQQNVDEWLGSEDQSVVDSWFEDLGNLPSRAQTMKAVVDAAVKWFVNPTMSEGSLALEDAIIAHQQQEPGGFLDSANEMTS